MVNILCGYWFIINCRSRSIMCELCVMAFRLFKKILLTVSFWVPSQSLWQIIWPSRMILFVPNLCLFPTTQYCCHLTAQFTKPRAGTVSGVAYPLAAVPPIHGHVLFQWNKTSRSRKAMSPWLCELRWKPRAHGFTASTGFIPLERYVAMDGRNVRERVRYPRDRTSPWLRELRCKLGNIRNEIDL